jgi:hypothetical protein
LEAYQFGIRVALPFSGNCEVSVPFLHFPPS